jgi:hypothetical protein
MKHRVSIGTCSGPAEAALVRSVFEAHELQVVINGEMHASAMGGLGGFVRLHILVDAEHVEDASALLRDIRDGAHAVSEGDELSAEPSADDDEPPGDPDDARADADGVWEAKHEAEEPAPAPAPAPAAPAPTTGFDNRRRRTGVVLLLSVMAGFGTAHMSTGAWGRGVLLAALTVASVGYAVTGRTSLGSWLFFGARFADLFGALWRVWSSPGSDRPAR